MNARIPTVELEETVELSSQQIGYRINKLIDLKVIQAFRVNIDFLKIGYNHFKVNIFLNKSSKRNKLWNNLKEIPNVTFINTSAGYADIEIEIEVKSSDEIIEVMDSIMSKEEGLIKKYIYWGADNFYKIRCLPEKTEKNFKKN
jgi:DNA-binding Lrp family transcriptional regulator